MKKFLATFGLVTLSVPASLSVVNCGTKETAGTIDDNAQQKMLAQTQTSNQLNHDIVNEFNDVASIENYILGSENRWFHHSYLTPTGYFLEKGKEYLIQINKNAVSNDLVYISIGQFGDYQNLNGGQSVGFETHQIIGNNVSVTPTISGMLYLKDYRFTENVSIVSISKTTPIKVPTFIIDESNQTDFFNQVKETTSPFIEVIANHVFGTFQTEMFKKDVINAKDTNIANTTESWDLIWKYTNEVYGLNEEYSGVAKKYQQFIHITNPDNGPGSASATNYRITFQNKGGAGKNLFVRKPDNQWGLWHEVGHTYQTNQYKWGDLTEVTVNISSLYVQQFLAKESNLETPSNISKVKAFLNSNDQNKDFNNEKDAFMKLSMFWQLQLAFGDHFYPTLSQYYRNNWVNGNAQQDFIKITSSITNRNLAPFYQKWGLKMDDATKKTIEQLPSLEKNIWENIINESKEPVVELELPKYQVSTLKSEVTSKKALDFGTKITDNNINEFLDISGNDNILANKTDLNWMNYVIRDNKYYIRTKIVVQDDNLLANSYTYYLPATFENTISFIGYAYYQRGLIGLNQETKAIVFKGTNTLIDASQSKDKKYYHITIKNQKNEIVKDVIFNAGDNFSKVVADNNLSQIPYEEGFTIEINNLLTNKARIFNPEKNTWEDNTKYSTKYLISNNKLVAVAIN